MPKLKAYEIVAPPVGGEGVAVHHLLVTSSFSYLRHVELRSGLRWYLHIHLAEGGVARLMLFFPLSLRGVLTLLRPTDSSLGHRMHVNRPQGSSGVTEVPTLSVPWAFSSLCVDTSAPFLCS